MTTLHIDFETRSTVDLKKTSTHAYAQHPTTDVWCMAWCVEVEDAIVNIWRPNDPVSDVLTRRCLELVRQGATVIAHNAAFEFVVWNELMAPRYGWPKLRIEQMRCTMAMAYALSLPGSLENAAAAVGLKEAKDMEGHRLMMQMARPRRIDKDGTIHWWDTPDRKERLYAYCRQDVEVERELEKRLLPLMPSEQRLWQLDQTINNRGVMVDLKAIDAALEVVASEKKRLDARIKELTGGVVGTCNQVMQLTEWIKSQGVDCVSLAKGDVAELLSMELPENVRGVLLCRQEAAKSSTAKLKAMKEAASNDGRVRGCFQYHGASTGRWAGRKIQPQNMPRGQLGLSETDIETIADYLGG